MGMGLGVTVGLWCPEETMAEDCAKQFWGGRGLTHGWCWWEGKAMEDGAGRRMTWDGARDRVQLVMVARGSTTSEGAAQGVEGRGWPQQPPEVTIVYH